MRFVLRRLLPFALTLGLSGPLAADPPAAPATTAPAAPSLGGPRITLTSPGEEPRQELRYRLGDIQPATATVEMAMRMGAVMGMPAQVLPKIRMVMSFVDPVASESGTLALGFRLDRMEVLPVEGIAPGVVEAMRGILGQMGTFTGSMTIGDRGDLRAFDMDLSGLDPVARQQVEGMRSSFDQMTIPFPAEEVGVGATWTVHQQIEQQGFRLDQVATYTLTALTEDEATLGVAIEQRALDQAISTPDLPAAAGVRGSMTGSGSGQMTIHFARMVPTSSISTQVEMRMTMGDPAAGGQALPPMQMEADVTIAPE